MTTTDTPTSPTHAPAAPEVVPPNTRLLYRFDGSFEKIVPIGPVADGFRLDGHFGGVLTAGELVGAQLTGVDYFRIRHDGVGVVTAHETVDLGAVTIGVELHGLLLPPDGVDAPTPADIVQPDFAWPTEPYTIHVSATFETAAPDLGHLNCTVVAHTGTVDFARGLLHVDAHVIG
jgi:hypothetical protein